ncbi:hypothetical protein IMSAG049_01548 [Clostridiales bacterium]|nr:hypothetical protein IMSAG049_01548 [Clostridiales bacterium]
MREFKRILSPLKKKIVINNVLKRILQCLFVALAVDFIIMVASKLVFVPHKTIICAALIVIAVLLGIALAFSKYRVTYYDAAEEGDRLGCDERLITAYGILKNGGEYTTMENMAVNDAVNMVKKSKLASNYKIVLPKRLALLTSVAAAAICFTGFAPNAGVYELTPTTRDAIKEAEEIKKSINNEDSLSKNFKEEYNKILKDLNKELKRAKDAKEAKKLINNAQKELKKLENKASHDKNSIKNALSDFSAGSDISSAMDLNNSEALAKAMEKLKLELEGLSKEEMEKLAEMLEELLSELSDEELKELLEQAQEAAEAADAKSLAEALSQAASLSLSKNSAAAAAVNRTASAMAKASDGTGKSATSAPSSNNSNKSGDGEGQGQGNGEGQGNGSGDGQGSGQGNGNGNGNGQGNGNGGTGVGIGGNGRGFGHTDPEKVFTRNAENMQGNEEQLQSQQTDDGNVTYSETKAGGVNGESVPYDAVVGNYKEQALKETENGNIPYGMRELIAEYFSGLE